LFWIETPSNPLWSVTDIAAVADIAHACDALLCVDSTVATPVFTRPAVLGRDIVMHSRQNISTVIPTSLLARWQPQAAASYGPAFAKCAASTVACSGLSKRGC